MPMNVRRDGRADVTIPSDEFSRAGVISSGALRPTSRSLVREPAFASPSTFACSSTSGSQGAPGAKIPNYFGAGRPSRRLSTSSPSCRTCNLAPRPGSHSGRTRAINSRPPCSLTPLTPWGVGGRAPSDRRGGHGGSRNPFFSTISGRREVQSILGASVAPPGGPHHSRRIRGVIFDKEPPGSVSPPRRPQCN